MTLIYECQTDVFEVLSFLHFPAGHVMMSECKDMKNRCWSSCYINEPAEQTDPS